ncbi:KAP family NTPase [Lentzea californiensis]|uniref:KAP family NTPase n=1 Tax=Lentzea californiensis TaxID=438851 RepID=UPI002166A98F|nr:KAP family NTPase [Lentzea californiensis]MCR3754371.1 KAP family P-loop domain-containing protein [Lentzea californiensis]
MADDLPWVRDVDRTKLLKEPSGSPGVYLPRDVDVQLDRALRRPGVVIVEAEAGGAGARRAVYEALLRVLPDKPIAVNPGEGEPPVPDSVAWFDYGGPPAQVDRTVPRWVIVFVPAVGGEWDWAEGAVVVRVPLYLSEEEKDDIRRLYPSLPPVDTVQEFLHHVRQAGPIRVHAGYRADDESGADRLGIEADVAMLADLVASRLIKPPLSIGLFGSWGSGKSFFMRQLERRIDDLSQRHPVYCSSVRQIRFNAWHYVEADLWASLATHIFDTLASGSAHDLERIADEFAEQRKEKTSLVDRLAAVRLERMAVAAKQQKTLGSARRRLSRQLSQGDLSFVAPGVTVPEFVWGQVRKDRAAIVTLLLGVLVVAGLFVVTAKWALALGALVAAATPVLARAGKAVTWFRELKDRQDPLDDRLAELDEEIEGLERSIAELAPDVTEYARTRDSDYQQHLGVVSLVRKDLEMFAAILASSTAGPERIVLYIDDLDRCPPPIVIKVLEAVHLLLAQPVFVVVVGVDARWLLRALKQHYTEMLDDPVDYLEKIFQVSFALRPMEDLGFRRLVSDLAGEEFGEASYLTPLNDDPQDLPWVANPEPVEEPGDSPGQAPRGMRITGPELLYLESLAPLVRTPRAAKRLVNLYRLVRARTAVLESDGFLSTDYRVVLVLLAALVGRSGQCDALFDAIESGVDWRQEMDRVVGDLAVPDDLSAYRKWLPLVRRFSFTTAACA